jgi:DNA-binding transcriptional regulator GbsR (MarR family)
VSPRPPSDSVAARDRALFVDLVGTEISAIWRNVTRLGGQCVASLYLSAGPRSMDDLAAELGRSKSNVFSNLRALEALGIVRRVRVPGSARDHYELAAPYPDVIVLAFIRRLSDVLSDKGAELRGIAERMAERARAPRTSDSGQGPGESERTECDADGPSAAGRAGRIETAEEAARVARLAETYARGGALLAALLPPSGTSLNLAALLDRVPPEVVRSVAQLLFSAPVDESK